MSSSIVQHDTACIPDSSSAAVESPVLSSMAHLGIRETIDADSVIESVCQHFAQKPNDCGVQIRKHNQLMGVIGRDELARALTRPFAMELWKRRQISEALQRWSTPVLEMPDTAPIADAVERALARKPEHRYSPLVVHDASDDWYLLDIHNLLVEQCRIQMKTLTALKQQREATMLAQREREALHQQLLTASRDAGRAEVATGILHNVGNVLNSVNASASFMAKTLQQSKVTNLGRATELLREHESDLARFLSTDERGMALPGYLMKLASFLAKEHTSLQEEIDSLGHSLEHIKQVVQMQQSYAKNRLIIEPVCPATLFEDALRVNMVSFDRHNVKVLRYFEDVESVKIDRHKVLQVLINLISNAKNATKHKPPEHREIVVRLSVVTSNNMQCIRFVVEDNGVGIAPENLTRIFSHGFTTRKEGHGFGLHSAANAAREMNGSLSVHSDGPGCGAMFTLIVPIQNEELRASASPAQLATSN